MLTWGGSREGTKQRVKKTSRRNTETQRSNKMWSERGGMRTKKQEALMYEEKRILLAWLIQENIAREKTKMKVIGWGRRREQGGGGVARKHSEDRTKTFLCLFAAGWCLKIWWSGRGRGRPGALNISSVTSRYFHLKSYWLSLEIKVGLILAELYMIF